MLQATLQQQQQPQQQPVTVQQVPQAPAQHAEAIGASATILLLLKVNHLIQQMENT